MNTDTKQLVISFLEAYQKHLRQIALLRYELAHPAHVTPGEMLDAMSFAHGDGSGYSKGHISNKTLYIALNYREQADKINAKEQDRIVSKLIPLEQQIDRLEHYVTLLEARQAVVIRRHYFEGCSWEQVGEELQLSPKTLRKVKSEAIAALAEMYEFAGTSD